MAASFWFVQTRKKAESWNDLSRMASIESLAERGTWQIDESSFASTGDKIFLNGHFYSTKPPLLQFFASQVYYVMYHQLDVELTNQSCADGDICVYRWLTFLFVGLASAFMLASFYWFSVKYTDSTWRSLLATILLMIGTMVWPYSLVFINHVPAAACLFVAFHLLLNAPKSNAWFSWRLFLCGLLLSLTVGFELTAIVIVAPLFLLAALRNPRNLPPLVLGGLGIVVLVIILNYQISGSILPPYLQIEGYKNSTSGLHANVAGNRPPGDLFQYIFDSLVGFRGVLSHNPILLWGIVGNLLGGLDQHKLVTSWLRLGSKKP